MIDIIETLPFLSIVIGKKLTGNQMASLVSARVAQKASCPTQCELVFVRSDATPLEPGIGDALEIGTHGSEAPFFSGTVTSIEHKRESDSGSYLFVRGYDVLYDLSRSNPCASYERQKFGDTIAAIAPDIAKRIVWHSHNPTLRFLVQYDETDLQFITRTAQQFGGYLFCRDRRIDMFNLRQGNGNNIAIEDSSAILQLSFEKNRAPLTEELPLDGWDPSSLRFFTRPADSRSGDVREKCRRHLCERAVGSEEEARIMAQSEKTRCEAGVNVYTGSIRGRFDLYPGVALQPGDSLFHNAKPAIVTEVEHTLSAVHGFISRFSTAVPETIGRPSGAAFIPGTVCSIDDPLKRGRVRVSYPTLNNVKSDWLNAVMPGAGKGKGLVMVPAKGDTVLIALSQNDASRGIILGGMYSEKAQPRTFGVKNDRVDTFAIHTPGGQSIVLSDDGNTLELATAAGSRISMQQNGKGLLIKNENGSYLEMDGGKTVLHSKCNLVIEAPGHSIEIRGAKIDFGQK